MGTVMAHDGKHLYISTGAARWFHPDTATNQVPGRSKRAAALGIAASPDDKTIYTANGPQRRVDHRRRDEAGDEEDSVAGGRGSAVVESK